MTIRGGGHPKQAMVLTPVSRLGPPPRSFAADAHDCIMVRSLWTYRIQGCGAMLRARWQAPLGPLCCPTKKITGARSKSTLTENAPYKACSAFTRVAACTLARPPIRDPLYRRLQPFRHLHDCSGCFRLERSPGGTCTHWKAPPSHGARK